MTRQPDTQEIARLRERLHLLFRLLDVTFKDVETSADLGLGQFSKVFSGSRDFRLEHIFFFCQSTGLDPAEFFHWVYPRLPMVTSEAARKLQRLQDELTGLESAGTTPTASDFPLFVTHGQFQGFSESTRKELAQALRERKRRGDLPLHETLEAERRMDAEIEAMLQPAKRTA
jgi:hypothetical protein